MLSPELGSVPTVVVECRRDLEEPVVQAAGTVASFQGFEDLGLKGSIGFGLYGIKHRAGDG